MSSLSAATQASELLSRAAPGSRIVYVEGTYYPGIDYGYDDCDDGVTRVVIEEGSKQASALLIIGADGVLDPESIVTFVNDEDNEVALRMTGNDIVSRVCPGEEGFVGFGGTYWDTEGGEEYCGPHGFAWEEAWVAPDGSEVMSIPFPGDEVEAVGDERDDDAEQQTDHS